MPLRVPHPVRTLSHAERNRLAICEPRGYCGPFLNQEFYDAYPDPLWHGMGECVHCCSTVHVAAELAKRVGLTLVPTSPPPAAETAAPEATPPPLSPA